MPRAEAQSCPIAPFRRLSANILENGARGDTPRCRRAFSISGVPRYSQAFDLQKPPAILTHFLALLMVLLAWTPLPAVSAPSPFEKPVPKRGGNQTLHVEIRIDGTSINLIAQVFRNSYGQFSAKRGELKEIGVLVPGSGQPDDIVALDAIPGLALRFDDAAQVMHLTLAPGARLARDYAAGGRDETLKQPVTVSREYGAVLNYSAYATSARAYAAGSKLSSTGTASLDARLFSPYGVLQNSAIVGNSLTKQGILRLETSISFAHQDSMTLGTLGDSISGGTGWSRPVRFGGAQISRQFSLRPDLVTAPLPSVSGSAAVPSTVDVFVDNIRVASQNVGTGPFRLNNLPVPSESGTARVVVRDVTGKETVSVLPFFTSAKLLAVDNFDYSVDAGVTRHSYAVESFDYSRKFMGMATGRYGVKDWLTLEGHAEGTAQLKLAGLGAIVGADRLGIFTAALAASHYQNKGGALANGSWQLSVNGIFVGISSQRSFGQYEDVASVTARINPTIASTNLIDSGFYLPSRSAKVAKTMDRLTLGMPVPGVNATAALSFVNIERAGEARSHLVGLTYSQTIAKKYNFFINGYGDLASRRDAGVTAGLSFVFDNGIVASSTASGSRDTRNIGAEVIRPVGPESTDYGWRAYSNEGSSTRRGVAGTYKTPWVRADAGLRQEGPIVGGHGELEGAIVATPAGVFASRRIHDSFAVVDVGVPGVEVLHENRPVGRTGWLGKVVVPDLHSFQRSKIAISPETVPGASIASLTETEVIPGFRGSTTVQARMIETKDTALIEIKDASGAHFPAGTKVKHVETGHLLTIGYGGITFMQSITDETTLRVMLGTSNCTVRFSRNDRNGPKGQIGPLGCKGE